MFTLVDGFVALVLLAGLLGNRFQPLPVAAIGLVALRGTVARIAKGEGFRKVEWAVLVCLGYWLATYFWSTGDVGNLISYKFLRQDGSFLVSYAAFFFLLGLPLTVRLCETFWFVFLSVLSVVGLAGTAITLNLPYSFLLNPLRVVILEEAVGGDMLVGWYEAHNTAGGVFAIASVMVLVLLQQEKVSQNGKIFRWFLLAGCMSGLIFTYSRGSYLAFCAGAAVVLPWRKLGTVVKVGLLVAVPAVLIMLATSSVMDRIDTITDPYYGTNASRLEIWGEAWDYFTLSPIVGIGFGRFNDDFKHYKGVKHVIWVATDAIIVNSDGHAHNSYLQFLAEGGIIGLFVTLYVWWCGWRELLYFEGRYPKSKLGWIEKSARGCLVVVCAHAMTEHALGRGSVVLILGALIGTTLATARLEERAAKHLAKRALRLAMPGQVVPAGRPGTVAVK
ncbi:MAG TPA: O-antigen ligase family protein [Terriglobia bacterium]|nr:O-antigen ligase family protein [Terriglobia bacterium]